jgi:glycosyltransferase involved in cell wall biosynthesis
MADISNKGNIVVTCSRFVPEKNLQIIPRIASLTPEIEYHIVGGTNKFSPPVIENILLEKEKLGCSNLYLHRDATAQELVDMYARGKIYLHTMIGEHFGISILEGMAAGLVPVIHRSGGAYMDIIENDKYGFSYETEEEAASIIRSIMAEPAKLREHSRIATDRAQFFSKERFKQEFLRLLCEAQ